MEFGRRMAGEKDLEKHASYNYSNISKKTQPLLFLIIVLVEYCELNPFLPSNSLECNFSL